MPPKESALVGVTYIHRRPSFTDNIYGSGLTFTQGQTRELPAELARNFLRHADVFELAKVKAEKPAKATKDDAPKPDDDGTKAQLEAANAKQAKERDEQNALMDIKDSVARMDAKQLAAYAMTHYQQKLDQKAGVKVLRGQVAQFIDQFGV